MSRGFGGRGFGGHGFGGRSPYGHYVHHHSGPFMPHTSAIGGIGRIVEHAVIYGAISHIIGPLFRGHSLLGSIVIGALLVGAVVVVSRLFRRRYT